MRLLRAFLSCRAAVAGLTLYSLCAGLDFFSTVLAMHIPNIIEMNPWVRDPHTLKFLVVPGIAIKVLAMLQATVPALFIFWGTEEDSSRWPVILPYFFLSIGDLNAAVNNFLLYVKLH